VIIPQAFAMGRFPVTFADYDVFAQESLRALPNDNDLSWERGWGRGNRPVISGSRYFCESFYGHPCPTNKDRLCARSEPQSYPVVGRARQ
jgi:formylglycine-generating enzyme required for sulfatase activity